MLMATTDEQAAESGPNAEGQSLVERVRASLGDEVRDVPGPLILIPYDVLPIAVSRDIATDADRPEEVPAEVTPQHSNATQGYGQLLRAIRKSADERGFRLAMNHLHSVSSADQLAHLFADHPVLATDRAIGRLSSEVDQAPMGEDRALAEAELRLVQGGVRGEFAAAWAAHEKWLGEMVADTYMPRVEELLSASDAQAAAGDWEGAAVTGKELCALARAAGADPIELLASVRTGLALFETAGVGRAERLERAIALFERALELIDAGASVGEPHERAHVLTNLGTVLASRLQGDPRANQDRAIDCLRKALSQLSMKVDGDSWALAQTNVGLCLLTRANEYQDGDDTRDDDPLAHPQAAADVEGAIRHFENALKWRSFRRSPGDWAYTEVNLGWAFDCRRRGSRRTNLAKAVHHFKRAAEGFRAAGDLVHAGQALHNLSGVSRVLADLGGTSKSDRVRLLSDAAAYAEGSLEAVPASIAPIEAGRARRQLGDVLLASGDRPGAIAKYRAALELLTPAAAPRLCRDTAWSLAGLYSDAGDWDAAADCWLTATQAADRTLQARTTLRGRLNELHSCVNLFRWAGYALARAGKPESAIETVELGRARELSTWLRDDEADLDLLRALDPSLCARFLESRARLEGVERDERAGISVSSESAARAAEEFGAALTAIRCLPGLDRFLTAVPFSELTSGLETTEALVYLITAPWGSVALIVRGDDSECHSIQMVEVPNLTSAQIVRVLLDVNMAAGSVGGYLPAQSEADEDALEASLHDLERSIGTNLLRPVADALRNTAVSRICLVPIGLLGLLPLHALGWSDNGRRCLVDDFAILVSPSAFVHSICKQRAVREMAHPKRFLVVGNPLPHPSPLDGAEREAAMVADVFAADELTLLVGTAATKNAVVDMLPGAQYVHFACHGSAQLHDTALTAGLSFANNEVLKASEVLNLRGFEPRLVVASACETGVIQGYESVDEVLALGTVFIGAGAATVVMSLWAVDDYPTALLMSRFYEVLAESERTLGRIDACAALRDAQLWLRELTPDTEESYLTSRPNLRAHREAKRSRSGSSAQLTSADRPYSPLHVWAPFVVTGT